ncbi:hypothetical protein KP509_16G082600 [Ceratopteris richardii]|uniref:Uncharacterized protein n=1 Tax=Ceratopteris richardii TaxID=49495 RepID=A0A8T2T192_CERRI|nr:hypothetical protein KP509_16G082600 [Ceratopteris richardii]
MKHKGLHHVHTDIRRDTQRHGGKEGAKKPSTGKTFLSNVKGSAKVIKNKLKKVTDLNRHESAHGNGQQYPDHANDGRNSSEEMTSSGYDEDDICMDENPMGTEVKYQQLRSIGVLEGQGDDMESEVHGGIAASTLAATREPIQMKSADDNTPISTYKAAGPVSTLQATPTEYHYHKASNHHQMTEGLQDAAEHTKRTSLGSMLQMSNCEAHEDRNPKQGICYYQSLSEAATSSPSNYSTSLSHKGPASCTLSDINVPYPHDIAIPNPEFGSPKSPASSKIAVRSDDLPTDMKRDACLALDDDSGHPGVLDAPVPEHSPMFFREEQSVERHIPNGITSIQVESLADGDKSETRRDVGQKCNEVTCIASTELANNVITSDSLCGTNEGPVFERERDMGDAHLENAASKSVATNASKDGENSNVWISGSAGDTSSKCKMEQTEYEDKDAGSWMNSTTESDGDCYDPNSLESPEFQEAFALQRRNAEEDVASGGLASAALEKDTVVGKMGFMGDDISHQTDSASTETNIDGPVGEEGQDAGAADNLEDNSVESQAEVRIKMKM